MLEAALGRATICKRKKLHLQKGEPVNHYGYRRGCEPKGLPASRHSGMLKTRSDGKFTSDVRVPWLQS